MNTERTMDPESQDQRDMTLRRDSDSTMRPATVEPELSVIEGTARVSPWMKISLMSVSF